LTLCIPLRLAMVLLLVSPSCYDTPSRYETFEK
jgi:hypothetical protein